MIRFSLGAIAAVAAYAGLCLVIFSTGQVWPHDAPTGWSYPTSCCSNYDCRAVAPAIVSEGPQGFVIEPTQEIIPYGDVRIKDSPDGEFHWCSVAGADDGRTLCLFVPPRSY